MTSRSAIFKRFLSRSNKYFEMGGNKDGLVERPFASYLFSLGSIPGPGVTCGLSFVVNSRPCSEGFSSGPILPRNSGQEEPPRGTPSAKSHLFCYHY